MVLSESGDKLHWLAYYTEFIPTRGRALREVSTRDA